MTIGSLATATLEEGSVVVVTGFVVVVTGLVVVVVPPALVVVVTGLVVVVTGLVVVVTGFVVVVTGFVVVVVGGGGGALTMTLPGVLVMKGTGSPADQPTCRTSMVLFVVRKAIVAERPLTRTLARPLAATAPLKAERSVAT